MSYRPDSQVLSLTNRTIIYGFGVALLLLFAVSSKAYAVVIHDRNPDLMGTHALMTGLSSVGKRQKDLNSTYAQANDAFHHDDYILAFRLWESLAYQGHTPSQYQVAMMHDVGQGIGRNPSKAVAWYERAARNGHRHAQHNLAVAYANGDGVELNIQKALEWWHLAAEQGNFDSAYNLGIVYATGIHGVARDLEKAKKWWRSAAIHGDPMAQYNLGTLYMNGEGIIKSYCEAERWWAKSAARGVPQATIALQILKSRKDYSSCW